MALFGLVSTEDLDSNRFKNHRRQILYSYPNGTAPLTALLNLCKEDETDDPHFRWEEKRNVQIAAVLANISTTVPFGAGTVASNVVTAVTVWAGNTAVAVGDTLTFAVADNSMLALNMVLRLESVITTGTAIDLVGEVYGLGTVSTIDYVAIKVRSGAGTIDYDAANAGKLASGVGMAATEGTTAVEYGSHNLPVEPENYTQIFKYNYQITGTNLKTAVKFDEQGSFPDQAKENAINFAKLTELAFLWGVKAKVADTANNSRPKRFTGGLLYHLAQWEAADSLYRGGTGAAAATANTDDNKRNIDLSSTPLTLDLLWGYLERCARTTGGSNSSNELLCYCGNFAFLQIQKLLRQQFQLTTTGRSKDTYQMDFVKVVTPVKTLMFQTHPLFNENSLLRSNILMLEPGNLVYRYLKGRDMQLLENQQPRNADYREDGWFGEVGLEVRYPDKMLHLRNLVSVEA